MFSDLHGLASWLAHGKCIRFGGYFYYSGTNKPGFACPGRRYFNGILAETIEAKMQNWVRSVTIYLFVLWLPVCFFFSFSLLKMPSLIPVCLLPFQATSHPPITCKVQQVGHFLESVTLHLLTEAWQTGNPFWAELVIVLRYPSGYLSMDRQRLWVLSGIVLSIGRPWQDLCAAS